MNAFITPNISPALRASNFLTKGAVIDRDAVFHKGSLSLIELLKNNDPASLLNLWRLNLFFQRQPTSFHGENYKTTKYVTKRDSNTSNEKFNEGIYCALNVFLRCPVEANQFEFVWEDCPMTSSSLSCCQLALPILTWLICACALTSEGTNSCPYPSAQAVMRL